MGNFNKQAIDLFGMDNLNMSIHSSSSPIDERRGELNTYLDTQFVKKLALPRLPESIRAKPYILDVGAGKGRMTMKFIEIARGVVAIEPFSSFYQDLKSRCIAKNLEIHQHTLFEYRKISDKLFDVIYISGVTQYLDDKEFEEFMIAVYDLLQPWGVVCIRDYGVLGRSSLRSSSQISRTVEEMSLNAKKAGFFVARFTRAYPINLPWVCYNKWKNKFTKTLWNFASLKYFFPLWEILPRINFDNKGPNFIIYLLQKDKLRVSR